MQDDLRCVGAIQILFFTRASVRLTSIMGPPVTCNLSSEFVCRDELPGRDRVCCPLTNCTANQFEARPATNMTDRVCWNITACQAPLSFAVAPPTPSSNRVCANVTRCQRDQYALTQPSATTNRMCRAVSNCSNTSFVGTSATPTSDAVCRNVTTCNAITHLSLLEKLRPRIGCVGTSSRVRPTCRCAPSLCRTRSPMSLCASLGPRAMQQPLDRAAVRRVAGDSNAQPMCP
jgi:hypothetical protein